VDTAVMVGSWFGESRWNPTFSGRKAQ